MHPEDEYDYYTSNTLLDDFSPNAGNCKRCIHKSHCGNKNKKEASWCEKYRPEIKRKIKRKKK